ncbi:DUF2231 domain-containing protein [Nocardioides psychrotolerans]|uniref:DUF2231 domain-containing protein n=1 Tax=Nocardioides psychrotolerans TaxID=1005945 RepID=UPI003137E04F
MFDLINGIPVHPLVVHAVVVLLPLAMLGTIAIAVRPRWRVTYGPLVVGSALVATILCPVATSSGEALEERVGDPGEHAELGESLVWFGLALVIFSAALVYLQRQQDKAVAADAGAATSKNTVLTVVAVLAVVAGLATTVQVYRVGDSGAQAAWEDAVSSPTGG